MFEILTVLRNSLKTLISSLSLILCVCVHASRPSQLRKNISYMFVTLWFHNTKYSLILVMLKDDLERRRVKLFQMPVQSLSFTYFLVGKGV